MAERLNAPVLKTGEDESLPGVRIPLYPPYYLFLYIYLLSSNHKILKHNNFTVRVNHSKMTTFFESRLSRRGNQKQFLQI